MPVLTEGIAIQVAEDMEGVVVVLQPLPVLLAAMAAMAASVVVEEAAVVLG